MAKQQAQPHHKHQEQMQPAPAGRRPATPGTLRLAALPSHPNNRVLRQAAIVQLQREIGNASLQRQLVRPLAHPAPAGTQPPSLQRAGPDDAVGVTVEDQYYDTLAGFEQIVLGEKESQPLVAARYRRAVLLLEHLEPASFTSQEDLDELVSDCLVAAESETETQRTLGDIAAHALRHFPEAFPETWATKVEEALTLDLDALGRCEAMVAAREQLAETRGELSAQILAHGLPLDLQEVGSTTSFKLTPEHADLGEVEFVQTYAQHLEAYARLKLASDVCLRWQDRAKSYAERVRNGEVVVSPADHELFLQQRDFLSTLPGEVAAARDLEDLSALLNAVLEGTYGQFNDVVVATILGVLPSRFETWRNGQDAFAASLAGADLEVRGEDYWARVGRAINWGYERGYFGESLRELWRGIVDNWAQILLIAGAFGAGIAVAQFIPVLNVIVDAAFLLWGGYEIFKLVRDVLGVLDAAGHAITVLRLQKASASMGRLAADKLLTLVEFVAAKGIHRLTKDVAARARQIRQADKDISQDDALKQAAKEVREEDKALRSKDEPVKGATPRDKLFGLRQLVPQEAGIPSSWLKVPLPLSGGQPVKVYRGFSRNVESHSAQVVRPGDRGGVLSRDPAAAHDAVFNHYGRDPVLHGPNQAGVVEITIPADKWDALAKTLNISERSYPGFSRQIDSTELRVNADEAIALINACAKKILAPDKKYDFRPPLR